MSGKDKDKTEQAKIGTYIKTRGSKTKTPSKVERSISEGNMPRNNERETPSIVVRGASDEEVPGASTEKGANTEKKKSTLHFNLSTRHTNLPPHLIRSHTEQKDAYKEPDETPIKNIKYEDLIKFQITKFEEEEDLPNFVHTTSALQFFRVLRELTFDWVRAKSHQKNMLDSMMSDQTPPGLRIHKSLEVISSSPQLKLKALQIFSVAEGKLIEAILEHYDIIIPKLEADINNIYTSMVGITEDEKTLIVLKLVAYKNELIRNHRTTYDKKTNKNNERRTQESNPSTSTDDAPKNQFPWDQKPPRPQKRGRGRPKKNLMQI